MRKGSLGPISDKLFQSRILLKVAKNLNHISVEHDLNFKPVFKLIETV